MPIPLPKPRHTVERSDNLVRVTLPSKKNALYVLWMCLWLFVWGYAGYVLLYIVTAFIVAFGIGKNSAPPSEPAGFFTFIGIFFLAWFLAFLALGAFAIYKLIWLLAGKEVIEANSKVLKISRQTFLGKSAKEYFAHEVKDLRVAAPLPRLLLLRGRQILSSPNDRIAFDYGARTFRFGSDIEEAEARQIILALQERLTTDQPTPDSAGSLA